MNSRTVDNIFDLAHLRECTSVFRDRLHAGRCIAAMIRETDAVVLGIPAGGIPVAAVVARILGFGLAVAVVSKITLPWNTEAGYGALAFDGSLRLNTRLIAQSGLTPDQVRTGIDRTRIKVAGRVQRLCGGRPLPELSGKTAIVVDDGMASGYTLEAAIAALTHCGLRRIVAAVPTGHAGAVEVIARQVHALYCPNIRSGPRFAVADAYKHWSDVSDSDVEDMLKSVETVPTTETSG